MGIDKVAFIGKGALGLMYGSMIEDALGPGHVQFVMDDAHFERHAGEKVSVNGVERDFEAVRVSQAAPADLLVFSVKATALDSAIAMAAPLVGPGTIIVSVLNGITSEERIAAVFGWDRLVYCVAQGMDAVFLDGRLSYSVCGKLRFGAAPGTDPAVVGDLDAFLTRAGVPHLVEDDIRHRLWAKFMLNVGVNQTCMVYGSTYGAVVVPGEQNRTFLAAMREAAAVARAEGVDLTEADVTSLARLMGTMAPDGMPSMAQDRINHKPTEVEEFSGTVIALARKHDILVPTNEWLYEQARAIEASWGQDQ